MLIALLNLMHFGAVLLASGFILSGGLLVGRYPFVAGSLLVLGAILLLIQLVSRLRHIRDLRTLRERAGSLEVRVPSSSQWVPVVRITSAHKGDFPRPDPWRPITLGYPGIEIKVSSISEPIKQLYPCGLEDLRDQVYDYLQGLRSQPWSGRR